MGHKINRIRATNDFSTSPFSTPASISEGLPEKDLPTVHPWSLFGNSSQDIIHRIICVLPTQAQIQLLLRFYVRWNCGFITYWLISWQVQQVDWYTKVRFERWWLDVSSEKSLYSGGTCAYIYDGGKLVAYPEAPKGGVINNLCSLDKFPAGACPPT